MQRHEEQRRWLLEIYQAALEAVAGDRVVRAWLQDHPQRVPPGLVAIGKAAERMAAGALDSLGTGVPAALVVLKSGQREGLLDGYPDVQVIESDHPVPGPASLAAGKALLEFLEAQPRERRLLFLLSGGASSLVEVPEPGIDLGLLRRTNDWLLGSGLDIARMNAVRQRLSAIKGGKLLRWLQGRPVEVLLISDVRGDDPAIIGSGLLWPPTESVPLPELPAWLAGRLPPLRPVTAPPPPHHLVATLGQALEAAAARARATGLPVHPNAAYLEGDAREQGEAFARFLLQADPGIYLKGGETTVRLPRHPGRGGRNQHLALAAARLIAGRPDILVLAAGTDGSDGPTEEAGALVDGGTLERGTLQSCDAESALLGADSGTFLEASGDLLRTGPTGTNVTDLLIGLKLGQGYVI
ncbi:MAG: hydroxypyruvate reductase [Gammaproteobacteria bacterium]|nr:MAG: hydroxypyruvate reductase [Gammaproteobacteria bacterium]RTZ73500.1 MAG: hydroxypyruvate reductase [Gammaproteobacteria bacterium]